MRVRVVGIERHWIHVLVGLEEVSVYQDGGSVCRGRGGCVQRDWMYCVWGCMFGVSVYDWRGLCV